MLYLLYLSIYSIWNSFFIHIFSERIIFYQVGSQLCQHHLLTNCALCHSVEIYFCHLLEWNNVALPH